MPEQTADERAAIQTCDEESIRLSQAPAIFPLYDVFRERFVTPWDMGSEHIGRRFTVVKKYTADEVFEERGEDIGPMYDILFEGEKEPYRAEACEVCVPDPAYVLHALADTTKARVYFANGIAYQSDDPSDAYRYWLNLPQGERAAYRKAGDATPIYSHDYVDRP